MAKKAPAPISLFAGPLFVPLCMGCAKRISSMLDAVIDKIEFGYLNEEKHGAIQQRP